MTQDVKEGGEHVSYCVVRMVNVCQQIFIALVFVFVFSVVAQEGLTQGPVTVHQSRSETLETHTSARLVQRLILPQAVWTSVSTVPPVLSLSRGERKG